MGVSMYAPAPFSVSATAWYSEHAMRTIGIRAGKPPITVGAISLSPPTTDTDVDDALAAVAVTNGPSPVAAEPQICLYTDARVLANTHTGTHMGTYTGKHTGTLTSEQTLP
jgi:hypothetical protein